MAITVSEKIKVILATQRSGEKLGAERVLALLEELRRQIIAELVGTPAGSYSTMFLQSSLASIDAHLSTWENAVRNQLGAALASSWESGMGLLPTAADTAGLALQVPWISGHTLDALKEFAFGRISAVRGDVYTRIKGELTLGVLGQKTPQQVAGQLAGDLEGQPMPVGRWGHPIFKSAAERAEVITGLEMGRAFSIANEQSIEAAQQTVPELERMRIHAGHPNAPRQAHLLMHGQTRKVGVAFYETATRAKVYFPRDPQAPVSEVIRCGCTHIPWHPEFGTKESFARDFDTRQKVANTPKGNNP
jgi:hypothetical protein